MFIYILFLAFAIIGFFYSIAKAKRCRIAKRVNHQFAAWCSEALNDFDEYERRVEFYKVWDVNAFFKLNGPKNLAEVLVDYHPIY